MCQTMVFHAGFLSSTVVRSVRDEGSFFGQLNFARGLLGSLGASRATPEGGMWVCGGGGGDVDGHNPAKPLSLQYHCLGLIEVDINLFGMDKNYRFGNDGNVCVCVLHVCTRFYHFFILFQICLVNFSVIQIIIVPGKQVAVNLTLNFTLVKNSNPVAWKNATFPMFSRYNHIMFSCYPGFLGCHRHQDQIPQFSPDFRIQS